MGLTISYSGFYGSSQRYAEELGRIMGTPSSDVREADFSITSAAVHFGSLYAGTVCGLSLFCRRLPPSVPFAVASVGIADPAISGNAEKIADDIRRIVPQDMHSRMRIYSLRGILDYSLLSPRHRAMMWMLRLWIKAGREMTDEDRMILGTYGGRSDFFDPRSVLPVAEWLRTL